MTDTTHEEWRVTGHPGNGYPPYVCTWSGAARDDPEGGARGFVALIQDGLPPWRDGPHIHRRTVTTTEWEAVEE